MSGSVVVVDDVVDGGLDGRAVDSVEGVIVVESVVELVAELVVFGDSVDGLIAVVLG